MSPDAFQDLRTPTNPSRPLLICSAWAVEHQWPILNYCYLNIFDYRYLSFDEIFVVMVGSIVFTPARYLTAFQFNC